MKKVLFICNQNMNRSKAAEQLFKDKFDTKSAGLYRNPVTEQDLSWADVIMVMEDVQRSEIAKRFPKQYLQKRILSLEIPDSFNYGDQKLNLLLKTRMKSYSYLALI